MEIERKFLIKELPANLEAFPHDTISQAYISTRPVIRVRQKNDSYILTLKSSGLLEREEVEMEIDKEAFSHLLAKKDGIVIEKTRYKIPEEHGYLIELDIFHGVYEGFIMAEIEFPSKDEAVSYLPPVWFGKDVTYDFHFHNSTLSGNSAKEIQDFLIYCKTENTL